MPVSEKNLGSPAQGIAVCSCWMRRPLGRELERAPAAGRWRRAGVVGWLCCIGGCQSILGIEELKQTARPGTGGAGGDAGVGSGGRAGALGGAAGGGDSGGGGGAGSGAVGPGAVGPGAAGPSDAGPSDAGARPITVSGRVIDFYRRPAPGLRVTIGAVEVLTDESGAFSVEGVEPPYDVSLIASTTVSDFAVRYYAYVYEGLTRPDPTLQVYHGLPGRSSSVNLGVSGATFEPGDNRRLIVAFSSPDGHYSASNVSVDTATLAVNWSGPATTAGNAHGLLVLRASDLAGAPPLEYEAYATTPLALADEGTSSLGLDLSASSIPGVALTGSVDAGTLGVATHQVSARLADGTLLPLLSEASNQGLFSYLVPSLPGASLTVAASAGSPAFSVAHVDGVPAAAAEDVALVLPRPVALNAPASSAQVGPGSTFAWSTVGQSARVFVWHLESQGFFEGIYVITARSQIELPDVPGYALTLPSDGEFSFTWSVETHGDYPSVDAATGPEGFFDSFALEKNLGTGLPRGDRGYYTNSALRLVNIAAP